MTSIKSNFLKISLVIIFSAALLMMLSPVLVSAKDKPIELRFSVIDQQGKGFSKLGHVPWVDMVEKATKGRVKTYIQHPKL